MPALGRGNESLLRVIVKILILVVVVKLTTFGWRPAKKFAPALSAQEIEISENIKEIVRFLSLDIGWRDYENYANLQEAKRYIVDRFKDLGYEVTTMPYEIEGRVFKNIIAQRHDSPDSGETVVVAAHYDSCRNPGADDNASGIAGMIELARLLKEERTKAKLKFIAFVNEEPPFFGTEKMGSRVYAKRAKAQGERIKAAIILDLIGYYKEGRNSQRYYPLMGPFYSNEGNFIAFLGNFASRNVIHSLKGYFANQTSFPVESLIAPSFTPGVNFSDHWSFWKEGFRAILITDTAFMRNPHYHSFSDLPETLDYGKTAQMVSGLKKAILDFANE